MKIQADESFATDAYLRAKSLWKGVVQKRGRGKRHADGTSSLPFSNGRDPQPLSALMAITTEDMGWTAEIEEAQLLTDWPSLIGENTASHTRVVELRDGLLIVQCDSTAWATELRRMRGQIMTRINNEYPDAGVNDLRFLAPGAPTWRHGSRVVRGRGPRDTYG